MNTVTFNKSELLQFINSDEFKTMPDVPISYIRAVSHINNPRANESDILLILVYNDFGLAGYLGIMPDLIFIDSKPQKIGWMSCIWVHENARGKGIAKKLTLKAIELWDNKIILTEYTPIAYNLYKTLNLFNVLTNKNGIRIFRRSCISSVLTSRYSKLHLIKPFFKLLDFLVNLIFDLFNNKKTLISDKNSSIEEITKTDNELESYIKQHFASNLFNRNKLELNWILDFPWVKQTKNISTESVTYQFTSEAKQFKNICYKISNNSIIVGFIMLTIRDNHLKTPYIYIEKGFENFAVKIINNVMIDNKINLLTTYNQSIINNVISELSFLYRKKIKRTYLTTIEIETNQNFIQDGDGDCAFV